MCNYEAAIAQFRKVVAVLQKQEHDDSLNGTRVTCSLRFANTLLQHSIDNEAETFVMFQKELDRCVDPLDREMILIDMGTGYRKIKKWDQSIEALQELCLSSTTRPDGTMLSQANEANEAIAQTSLEQYCTDTTLTIDQRTETLFYAQRYSFRVHIVSTEMHLTQAQLFYFNGDKQQAIHGCSLGRMQAQLLHLQAKGQTRVCSFQLRELQGRIICGSKHQKMTWKNERICHKVLCPLLGYWRMAKQKQKKHKGLTDEDRREYERVFETFFESICCYGLIIEDGDLQKTDSTDLKSRQEATQIAKEDSKKQ